MKFSSSSWFSLQNLLYSEQIQVAVVMFLCSIFFLGHTIGTIITIYLIMSPLYHLVIAYLVWVYFIDFETSQKKGRRFHFFRHLKTWHLFRDYFPIKLVRTKRLNPKRNYIFGYHPHGIMCCGAWLNFATEATGFSGLFPGIKPYLLTLKLMFKFPLFREFTMAGGVCDVSKESINCICQNGTGNAAIIVVGGAAESLEARPGSHRLKLKTRKGFVKIALQNGASLVPVYSFGENELFEQLENPKGSFLRAFQTQFQKFLSFAPPMFFGRGILPNTIGFLPHKVPMVTVVGSPIIVKKAIPNPTPKQLDALHKKYIQGLIKLFHEHKHKYGISKDAKLILE